MWTPERPHCRSSDAIIINFEHISHIVRVFPLLTNAYSILLG